MMKKKVLRDQFLSSNASQITTHKMIACLKLERWYIIFSKNYCIYDMISTPTQEKKYLINYAFDPSMVIKLKV